MCELQGIAREVIEVVLGGPVAWRTPEEVAGALGWDVERTCDELACLDVDGWLDVWERDDGPVVTLSARAAERLGVRLVEIGRDETPRWIGLGEPDPPSPRARGVCHGPRAADLDFLIDPQPPPDEAVALADRPTRTGDGPRPAVLIGLGLTPWPGPSSGGEPTCPACGSNRLRPNEYCLRCDRWGRDPAQNAPRAGPAVRPTRARARDDRRDREARGNLERALRKQRHRQRMIDREAARRRRPAPAPQRRLVPDGSPGLVPPVPT